MSGTSSPTSGFSRLPPIVTSEVDRQFLKSLNEYIEQELKNINTDEDEQRYVIYKTAFNRIIEHVTAYQPLLTTIKKEYEDTIEAIKKAQREATFLHGKLKAMASEPSTIRNYKKRADELEERINVVKSDNERLNKRLLELKLKRSDMEKKEKEITEPPKRELKKDHRLIPGFTLEECTNKDLLHQKLEQLDRQLKELTISFKTRYVAKTKKIELKDGLDNKVSYRDTLLRQGHFFKAKRQRLKVALEAAQAYNRVKPPHQTVGDAVMMALHQASHQARKQRQKELAEQQQGGHSEGAVAQEGSDGPDNTSAFDDDDPNKEKEAEMMLEYIEKFNELFEDGKYNEAAVHAANSPKGILRTSATLSKFRDVKVRVNGRTPLLMFCDSLMSSVTSDQNKPDKKLSLECVQCVLTENRLDLLAHWVAQRKLTLSPVVGHTICDHCRCPVPCRCTCQAIGQNIFLALHMYHEAVVCLLRQGRIKAGLELAKHRAPFSREDYIRVLRRCPSIQLVTALVEGDNPGNRLLPVGLVLMTLVQEDKFDLALPFIQSLQNTSLPDNTGTSVFHAAVLDDYETSVDDWNELIHLLQDQGLEETAMNLLASVTVLLAMQGALRTSQEFEQEEQGPDQVQRDQGSGDKQEDTH